jgi:superfamily II DNA/RNA helicase
MSFSTLGLHPDLLRTLTQRGHLRPTPIQASAIPAALAGRDLIGAAVTGSGKTLAYVLPMLQNLLRLLHTEPETPRPVRALVLVPSRELALQVSDTFLAYAQALALRVKLVTAVGGVSINPQLMALRGGADVVVATPGRLLDLAARRRLSSSEQAHQRRNDLEQAHQRRNDLEQPRQRLRGPEPAHSGLRLDRLQTLVLDEADRLLDEGFADELGRVLGLLPARRQQWLFSATFGPDAMALARDLLHDPVMIGVMAHGEDGRSGRLPTGHTPSLPSASGPDDRPAATDAVAEAAEATAPALPATLVQRAIQVDTAQRTPLLRHLIRTEGWTRVLVFVATRHAADHVAAKLHAAGLRAAALHGELSQDARSAALADFRSGAASVLVATDMAARGLHIEQLPAVVNYELARSPATHVHRVGRTARQGAAGVAVSFIAADNPAQEAHFRLIEKRQGQRVPREQVPGFEPAPPTEQGPRATLAASPDTPIAEADTTAAAGAAIAAMHDAPTPRKGLDPNGGIKGRRKSRKDKLREALAASSERSHRA